MTLTEITSLALSRLNRTSGNTGKYEELFALYANDAIRSIAEKYQAVKAETVALSNASFNVSALSNDLFAIVRILDSEGNTLEFDVPDDEETGKIVVTTEESSVKVVYRFVPDAIKNSQDVPDIPERYHGMIVYWVAGCELSNGEDVSMAAASSNFQMFNRELSKVRPATFGAESARKLKNYM
jgi:hypothetical protein